MLWNNEGFIIIHFSGSLSEFSVSYGACFGRLHISSTKGKSQLSFYKDRDSLLRRMEDLYHHLSKTTQILLLLAQQIFLHHLHHFVIITIIITLIISITISIIVIVIMEGKKTAQKQKERFVKAKVSSHSLTRISTFSSSFYIRDGDDVAAEKRSRIYIFLISH